ncbi:transcriptional regulator [Thalassotalea insulae]|uniref:Transcriptional regulator n=1 Tax=Thalassotalea insulae TaxID=2056778 RepID=A0ABQ6GZ61_9GAMM|nr:LysR family transcriptional regulator [Thalassotalea insulae]GLX79506.1 transcriptional regulator [Thalassotalea insulae]
MFKTESLQAFVSVAEHQSFTDAAAKHSQTPMALSKQVSQLELKLGEALFIRTTRKVRLTEFGEAFYHKAQDILQQHLLLDEWLETREEKLAGTLTICAQHGDMYVETIYPWVDEFCQLYPEINLRFDVNESVIDIHQQQYDIYWGVSEYLGEKFNGLKKRFLWRSKYGIYAAPQYLKKYGVPTTIKELQEHKVIGYLHNQPNNILVYKNPEDSSDKPYEAIELASDIQTVAGLTELAAQGLGLINAAADQLDIKRHVLQGTLVAVLEDHWSDAAEIYIYYHQTKVMQTKVRAFIDFFLAKRPLWSA